MSRLSSAALIFTALTSGCGDILDSEQSTDAIPVPAKKADSLSPVQLAEMCKAAGGTYESLLSNTAQINTVISELVEPLAPAVVDLAFVNQVKVETTAWLGDADISIEPYQATYDHVSRSQASDGKIQASRNSIFEARSGLQKFGLISGFLGEEGMDKQEVLTSKVIAERTLRNRVIDEGMAELTVSTGWDCKAIAQTLFLTGSLPHSKAEIFTVVTSSTAQLTIGEEPTPLVTPVLHEDVSANHAALMSELISLNLEIDGAQQVLEGSISRYGEGVNSDLSAYADDTPQDMSFKLQLVTTKPEATAGE